MPTFTWLPDYGATTTPKVRTRKAQFEDGYQQRVPAGLNYKPRAVALTFSDRTNAEALAIFNFLDTQGGVANFDWTDTVLGYTGKFICEDYSFAPSMGALATVTATFEQVFEV